MCLRNGIVVGRIFFSTQRAIRPLLNVGQRARRADQARGAIVLQQKVSRSQLGRRLANIPRCLIGMETCSGSHHIGRQLAAVGHNVRLIPAQYVKPFLKGHKNDYRDAEAIAEAVQRPTMHFVVSLGCARIPMMARSNCSTSEA